MYETNLTAVGTLITAVDRRRFADGTTKVNFRIACNERRFDRVGNGWVDGSSLYLSVSCWRDLGENVHASFVVGDPIIVRGRLVTREWEKDGNRRSVTELEATSVGPDLNRCVARITRTKRGGSVSESGGLPVGDAAGGSVGAEAGSAARSDAADSTSIPASPTATISGTRVATNWGSDSIGGSEPGSADQGDPWQIGSEDGSRGIAADAADRDEDWIVDGAGAHGDAPVEVGVGA